MKLHHLKNEIHQTIECFYCNNDLSRNKWDSLFHSLHHYKQTNCENCGRTLRVKVRYNGSGHDCWDPNSEFCKLIGGMPVSKKLLEEKIK